MRKLKKLEQEREALANSLKCFSTGSEIDGEASPPASEVQLPQPGQRTTALGLPYNLGLPQFASFEPSELRRKLQEKKA